MITFIVVILLKDLWLGIVFPVGLYGN